YRPFPTRLLRNWVKNMALGAWLLSFPVCAPSPLLSRHTHNLLRLKVCTPSTWKSASLSLFLRQCVTRWWIGPKFIMHFLARNGRIEHTHKAGKLRGAQHMFVIVVERVQSARP